MKTETRRITTLQDLSNDSMVEIMLLLPLSSIIQCFNVCKRWRSLIIGCPSLLTKTVNVACISHHYFHKYTFLEEGQRRNKSPELDFFIDSPMGGLSAYLTHLSCNGLLFSYFFSIRKADLSRCYISNPLTKECVRLPNPTMARYDSLWGLAFENDTSIINSSCNNLAFFKIVMGAHSVNPDKKNASYRFEIYSSDTRRWQLLKRDSKPHDHYWGSLEENAVYCNRVLYWHCHGSKALMFNLETETCGYLDLPRDHGEIYMTKLTVCAGSLHCIRKHVSGCRLSVLKMLMSGEWLILHDVDLQGGMERCSCLFPMHTEITDSSNLAPLYMSCEGDDKVLFNDNFKRIVSYDLKREVFEIVLERDFILFSRLYQYTPTNKRIVQEELQDGFSTESSIQFK